MELNFDSLNNLSPQQKLELEARLIGYEKLPPTIEQFVNDPYYMGSIYGNGKLYRYWLPVLKKIYPTPIHTAYNVVVLTGALGVGKSTVARLAAAYTKCRLDHMTNFNFFDLAKGKDLVMSYFHTTGDLVDNTFIHPLNKLKDEVPYFKEGMINNHKILDRADTPKQPLGS
jgi:predicted ATPase